MVLQSKTLCEHPVLSTKTLFIFVCENLCPFGTYFANRIRYSNGNIYCEAPHECPNGWKFSYESVRAKTDKTGHYNVYNDLYWRF